MTFIITERFFPAHNCTLYGFRLSNGYRCLPMCDTRKEAISCAQFRVERFLGQRA